MLRGNGKEIMVEISKEEVKKIQYNILDVVAKYCDDRGIRYFLGYGTLLGAIRHKGFIPWDDDIDIVMLREDYERFLKYFTTKNYYVDANIKNADFPYTFSKICDKRTKLIENSDFNYDIGINIDLFPIDKVPVSIFKQKLLSLQLKTLLVIFRTKGISLNKDRNWVKNFILLIGKVFLLPFDYQTVIKRINKLATKYAHLKEYKLGCLIDSYGPMELIDPSIFKDIIYVEFESGRFKAPKKFEEYLKLLYGDYSLLPPVEKRVTHHKFNAYHIGD